MAIVEQTPLDHLTSEAFRMLTVSRVRRVFQAPSRTRIFRHEARISAYRHFPCLRP